METQPAEKSVDERLAAIERVLLPQTAPAEINEKVQFNHERLDSVVAAVNTQAAQIARLEAEVAALKAQG